MRNELLYTGRRLDPETGLQLNRNRFYHQQLGRWASRDLIGYRGGINLYGYVNSQPTYYVDPSGLVCALGVCEQWDTEHPGPKPLPRWPIDDLGELFPDSDIDELVDDLSEIQDQIENSGGTVRFYLPGESRENGDGSRCIEADELVEDRFKGNDDWFYYHQEYDGWGWQFGDGDHNWGYVTGPNGEELYIDFWLNEDNPILLVPPR